MSRILALVLFLLALTAGEARGAEFEVVVVPGLRLTDLPRLEERGAVGLLVPGAGPRTSSDLARAALVRGEVRNSLRGGLPSGRPLVAAQTGALGSAAGAAIYLGLPAGGEQPNDRRYPILVVGPGYRGILTSDSTRIPGVVSVADVAPTALGEKESLGHAARADSASELLELDSRIAANADWHRAAVAVAGALVLLLALASPPAALGGIAGALAANLLLGLAGLSALGAVVVLALAVLLGAALVTFARPAPVRLGLALAAVVAAYLVVLAADGPAVALSPLGPTQNGRFYGLSNVLETLLLLPALAAAALLLARFGWPAFAGVAALAFVTVAGNRFGADGGGALVLAAGFAVLGAMLAGAGRRALAAAVAVALALVLVLVGLDAATGATSHVTRALEDGPSGLAGALRDRVALSWARATDTWYAAAGIAALVFAGLALVARTLTRHGAGRASAVPLALAAALGTSLLVNDSPVDVLLVGVPAFLAADLGMIRARWPGPPSRSRWPSLWRSRSHSPAAAAARRSRPRPRP